MNILLISRGYPKEDDPLFGSFEAEQARALHRAGCNLTVFYVDWRPKSPGKRKRGICHFNDAGIDVWGIYLFPCPIKFLSYLSIKIRTYLCRLLFIKAKKKGLCPDIIHAHYLFNLPLASAIGKKYRIPIVETEHWSVLMSHNKQSYLNNYSKYYKDAKGIISVSRSLQESMREKLNIESCVIPNIVAEEYVKSEILVPNSAKKSFRFLAMGRLVSVKNFRQLIFCAYELLNKGYDIELCIAGDGPLKMELESQIKSLNIASKVLLLGSLDKDQIVKIMQVSDIFVMTSLRETFSVVCIEAMAAGLPVIATSCGGPNEFINDKNGLLIPVNDNIALTDAMVYMINNYSKYDRSNIKKGCIEKFSSEKIAQQILNVYAKIL